MAAEWQEDDTPGTAHTALVMAVDAPSIELARAAWLHEKRGRSDSVKTERAYSSTFDAFRDALRSHWLDIDADPRKVALVAQGWAAAPRERDGRPVSSATYNQRLAVVSSFYVFARRRGLLPRLERNPIELVNRRPVQDYASARPLEYDSVAERLGAIDRTTPAGLRDYALLALALQTGRRLSELAALTWGDIYLSGGRATVTWRRCKGGKTMHDTLPDAA